MDPLSLHTHFNISAASACNPPAFVGIAAICQAQLPPRLWQNTSGQLHLSNIHFLDLGSFTVDELTNSKAVRARRKATVALSRSNESP